MSDDQKSHQATRAKRTRKPGEASVGAARADQKPSNGASFNDQHPLQNEKPNEFTGLLRELVADRRRAIDAIRAGLPASLLKDMGVYFDLPAHRMRSIVRVPETTAHALVKRGAPLDAAASERVWRLADLAAMAKQVFEDESAAKVWLRSPNRTFHGMAPMDLLDTEPGAMSVRQVLNAIATGGAA